MMRLKEGDRSAIQEVYSLVWKPVCSFVSRWVSDSSAVEDIAQQSLIKLYEQAPNYNPEKNPWAWLMTIAYWEIKSEIRNAHRKGKWQAHSFVDHHSSPQANPELSFLEREYKQSVEHAIQHLSAKEREAILQSLKKTPLSSTQRKRKERALAKLRKFIKKADHV